MVKTILQKIKEDLIEKISKEDIKKLDIFQTHFGVCLYIRNTYLWGNDFISRLLMGYFDDDNVDDLSHKILEYIIEND